DLGTASVVFCLALVMLWTVGLPWRFFVAVGFAGVAGFIAFMKIKPYSAERLTAFLHPNANLLASGYQLFQSKIGLGAGGLTGLGLGHSREKYGLLPNAHTDFIFTIIGEELGLVGTLCVLALFVGFLVTAVRIAQRSAHGTHRLIVVGVTTWRMVEAGINVASVVGWWAVTGVPLPFFSYGGTALIVELFAVGLLYNVAHDRSRAPDLVVVDATAPRGRAHRAPRPVGAPVRARVAPAPRRRAPRRATAGRPGRAHGPAPRRYRPEG
ncbi:MAG: FtsW/RodA/SpoVE family cell cycle protein, partial [Acidimicrobiales bacterium]